MWRLKCIRSYHMSQVNSNQEASAVQAGFHIVAEITEDSEMQSLYIRHLKSQKTLCTKIFLQSVL